jgi:hypothetical protein
VFEWAVVTSGDAKEDQEMLNWKVVTKSVSSFAAITFMLCVMFGLVAPARFHAAWLLEAFLPGFKWLSLGAFMLGLVEAAAYGAGVGMLYSVIHNFFARRTDPNVQRVTPASA